MRTLMQLPLLALMLAGFASPLQAQFLKIGPKAGANLVKVQGQSFQDNYRLGYYAGGFMEVRLAKNWFLQPEVLFAETSLRESSDFRDIYRNVLRADTLKGIRLQTLSFPVLLNYRIANVLSLSAGPQFSMIMDRGNTLLVNAGNTFSKGDVAMMAGANIMLGKLRVSGRYAWGLRELNGIDGQDSWRSQTAQLGLGFVF